MHQNNRVGIIKSQRKPTQT